MGRVKQKDSWKIPILRVINTLYKMTQRYLICLFQIDIRQDMS